MSTVWRAPGQFDMRLTALHICASQPYTEKARTCRFGRVLYLVRVRFDRDQDLVAKRMVDGACPSWPADSVDLGCLHRATCGVVLSVASSGKGQCYCQGLVHATHGGR
jgi:hypothetical protein